jgi:hypothetical protein
VTDLRDRLPSVPERGRAVVLPGRGYTPAKPLLAAVGDLLLERGWAVREVWWEVPAAERSSRWWRTWVAEHARTAAEGWSDRPLLVGKSLGSLAAPYAAKHRLEAVWLTPLLLDWAVARAIAANPARQLVVAGDADRIAWDARAARRLDAEVLVLPDADHSLAVKGDRERTAAHRDRVCAAVAAWLR